MKLGEVEGRLLAEGCNKNQFAVGARGNADDAFCLVYQKQRWEMFYTERGQDSPPIFTSESEEEACEYFCQYIIRQEQWHLVGWFGREKDAVELEQRIHALGAKPVRNDVPELGGHKFRVFVLGRDIFPVLKAFSDLPLLKDLSYPTGTINNIKLGARWDYEALSKFL